MNKEERKEERKENKGKKRKIKKIILSIFCILFVLLLVGDYILTVYVYNDNFNIRCDTYEPTSFKVEDFDGLTRTRYEFTSNKGQKLVGYLYEADTQNSESEAETESENENSEGTSSKKGIIIMAHGFGGAHNSYMDIANEFAQNGYYVFAYDATGCDESEGEGVGGFPQGIADLDAAITFVEGCDDIPELPIGLFGHSWGGYCVSAVLQYHPEVNAVIECCGFNESPKLFEEHGKDQAGDFIYAMTPCVRLYERIKFGKYAKTTAMDGFAASDADVMVVHSKDDEVVPVYLGYDIYYEKYKDDSRFTFVEYEDKGHNYIFNDHTYIDELNEEFAAYVETLDYDYEAEENNDRFAEDKAAWIHENLDREKYCNTLDPEVMEMFVDFYEEKM